RRQSDHVTTGRAAGELREIERQVLRAGVRIVRPRRRAVGVLRDVANARQLRLLLRREDLRELAVLADLIADVKALADPRRGKPTREIVVDGAIARARNESVAERVLPLG